MVDLFFYREPEEAKEQEEEEATAAPDYADYGAAALAGAGDWGAQITDAQWAGDAGPAAIPVVAATGWAGDAVPAAVDGFDAGVAPTLPPPIEGAASGWE